VPAGNPVSVHLKRYDHFKNGDVDFEAFFVVEILHRVGAVHLSHLGAKVATADILISLTGVEDGLHSNDTLPFYFAGASIAVEDMPVAAMKLDGEIIMILDSNAIGKHIFTGDRIRIIRLVKGLDTHLDPF